MELFASSVPLWLWCAGLLFKLAVLLAVAGVTRLLLIFIFGTKNKSSAKRELEETKEP